MITLGVSGGFNRPHETTFMLPSEVNHDSAAVLVRDGRVVAAIEQERLDRIKHSNKWAREAIGACLAEAKISLDAVDAIAVCYNENRCRELLTMQATRPSFELPSWCEGRIEAFTNPFEWFGRRLLEDFGVAPRERMRFVSHYDSHSMSAWAHSGFDQCLLLTIDGFGDDGTAGGVYVARDRTLSRLSEIPAPMSLGLFYLMVTNHLGFKLFDEYKIMGLAPYGDRARFREVFKECYELLPEGGFGIKGLEALGRAVPVRKPTQPLEQVHNDIAAGLQDALEDIVLHVLRHYREATGMRDLALSGGVAHNCTMNGRIAESGLFDRVFVQPAAHDAGCALGAALLVAAELDPDTRFEPLSQLYWGRAIPEPTEIEKTLSAWGRFVSFRRLEDGSGAVARLLASGKVVGWAQGRAEFGPRALGNRSILADPRPASNKDRINAMVKKREGFRPFAPAVLEERAADWFDVKSSCKGLPYMIFTVDVRPEKRATLGAVTHVDGSARVQSVSASTNPRFWGLIKAFEEETGVPILLNTSFNNNAEPIVDSVSDAIVTFLTTNIDFLVVDDFLVSKHDPSVEDYASLVPTLPPHVDATRIRHANGDVEHFVASNVLRGYMDLVPVSQRDLSRSMYEVVIASGGNRSVGAIAREVGVELPAILEELNELWARRLIVLGPAAVP